MRDAYRARHAAVGLVELGDFGAMVGGIDGLQDIGRLQSVQRQLLRAQFQMQFRLARRHFQTHVAAMGQHFQYLGNFCRDAVVGIQIRTEYADEERRGFTGQRLADAFDQHRIDLDQLVRKGVEGLTNALLDLGRAVALRGIDLHFKLALVRRIRILSVFGAADLLGDALYAGNGRQALRDASPDARGLGQRNAWAQ